MDQGQALREHLTKLLDWNDAHVGFDQVVAGVPADKRGVRPEPLPYSLWQLLEHIRLAQSDIVEFCRNADYQQRAWPDDYWPRAENPPAPGAWEESVASVRADRNALIEMVTDPNVDLFTKVPHGEGQTYLREVLLLADHNAYHLGEMVAVRRLLGIWKT